jgi:hypothetical protein
LSLQRLTLSLRLTPLTLSYAHKIFHAHVVFSCESETDANEFRYYSYTSTDMVEEYIGRGLLRLNKELNDEDAV